MGIFPQMTVLSLWDTLEEYKAEHTLGNYLRDLSLRLCYMNIYLPGVCISSFRFT